MEEPSQIFDLGAWSEKREALRADARKVTSGIRVIESQLIWECNLKEREIHLLDEDFMESVEALLNTATDLRSRVRQVKSDIQDLEVRERAEIQRRFEQERRRTERAENEREKAEQERIRAAKEHLRSEQEARMKAAANARRRVLVFMGLAALLVIFLAEFYVMTRSVAP